MRAVRRLLRGGLPFSLHPCGWPWSLLLSPTLRQVPIWTVTVRRADPFPCFHRAPLLYAARTFLWPCGQRPSYPRACRKSSLHAPLLYPTPAASARCPPIAERRVGHKSIVGTRAARTARRLVRGQGFEPQFAAPKAVVLPLDDPRKSPPYYTGASPACQKAAGLYRERRQPSGWDRSGCTACALAGRAALRRACLRFRGGTQSGHAGSIARCRFCRPARCALGTPR